MDQIHIDGTAIRAMVRGIAISQIGFMAIDKSKTFFDCVSGEFRTDSSIVMFLLSKASVSCQLTPHTED